MSPLEKGSKELSAWPSGEWIRRMNLYEAWPRELDLPEAATRLAALALARDVILTGAIDQCLLAAAAREFRCADSPDAIEPELVSPVQLNALALAGIITLDDADKYWSEWANWSAVDWAD